MNYTSKCTSVEFDWVETLEIKMAKFYPFIRQDNKPIFMIGDTFYAIKSKFKLDFYELMNT